MGEQDGHAHHAHSRDHLHAPDGVEPAVCSFTQTREGGNSPAEWEQRYTRAIRSLSRWVEEKDALVGHIKLILTAGEETLWLSSTGDGVSVRKTPGWDAHAAGPCELCFTAILYGVDLAGLEARVHAVLK